MSKLLLLNIKFKFLVVCISVLLISFPGCFDQSTPQQPSSSADSEVKDDTYDDVSSTDTISDTVISGTTNDTVTQQAPSADNDTTECYTAITADNIHIKMMRYHPAPDVAFSKGKQPVLLLPGIALNINEFNVHTPESRQYYKNMVLPQPLADWAAGDKYIQEDPMKYYSIAHYLWLKGYDVWLANYRGVGRDEYKSEGGSVLTNLDVWATLDTPACIDKIYEITGLYPVIGGHSTGGLVAYAYLQGTYIDVNELGNGYIPHVKSDPALAAQRNKNIKGFLGLDPAGYPPMPAEAFIMKTYPVYIAIGLPIYFFLDPIIDDLVNYIVPGKNFFSMVLEIAFGAISGFEDVLSLVLPDVLNLFTYVNFWEVKNTNSYVQDYFVRYIASSIYMRGMSQYMDMGFNKCVREHWKNGEENKNKIMGPKRGASTDNYYYYDDNMYLMTVPAICMFSEQSSLVDTQTMVDVLMEGKTANVNDEWYEVPGTAHADLPIGLNAPTYTFPKIGAWLEKICR